MNEHQDVVKELREALAKAVRAGNLSDFEVAIKEYRILMARRVPALLDAFEAMQAELEAARAVIAKLPKCWRLNEQGELVQDVPVVLGLKVWAWRWNYMIEGRMEREGDKPIVVEATLDGLMCDAINGNPNRIELTIHVNEFFGGFVHGPLYSTEAAALAAQRTQQEGASDE